MTPDEFKTALDTLGYSPASIAKALEVNTRTARRWVSGANEIPDSIAELVTAMVAAGGMTPEVQAMIEARRIGSLAEPETTRFIWVKRLEGDPRWVVAEHDLVSHMFYLPGSLARLVADELFLGPAVEPPDSDQDAE